MTCRSMHHPKLRVYLFSILMFRTYLEGLDGLKESHVRHLFYQLVEKSPGDWTEENIGEKFLLLLR